MIQNEHSVYEQPSVYNQGGGGNGSILVPWYLQPVEYIDTRLCAGSIDIILPWQYEQNIDDEIFVYMSDLQQDGLCAFSLCPALGPSVTNPFFVIFRKSNGEYAVHNRYMMPDITPGALHPDDILEFKFNTNESRATITDQHGNTRTNTQYGGFNSGKWGTVSIFGIEGQYTQTSKCVFYKAALKNGNNVKMGVIPCRNTINGEPCVVEVTTGIVGKNYTNQIDLTGVIFGPDIDINNLAL